MLRVDGLGHQNSCAHRRNPMDMMRQGLIDKLVPGLATMVDKIVV
jgi:hypothetical protein